MVEKILVFCRWTMLYAAVCIVFGWFTAALVTANAATATLYELNNPPGEPFAKIEIINECGDYPEDITLETSRGPVKVRFHENRNGCADEPDTFEVIDMPPNVSADPFILELTEKSTLEPSDPGYIYLYEFQGM